jgi:hypothetical protein
MKLILVRTAYFETGVWGVMYRDNFPLCLTLERPFLLGEDGLTKKNISCVPAGTYPIKKVTRHPGRRDAIEVWELEDVEEDHRTKIQIHIGNWIKDSLGCILVGTEMSSSGGDRAMILSSGKAFHRLMALTDEEGVPPPTVNPRTNPFQKSEIIIQDTAIQI